MNVILRNSTRRMIDQSHASVEAEGFIAWLRTDGYTDYVIDCHIRRLLFVIPKLSSGTSPPTPRDADLVAVFGRERRPLTPGFRGLAIICRNTDISFGNRRNRTSGAAGLCR